ncbi:trihelix transcription factor GTL2-like [Juglans microcarpa x Juglans regia]|uniref:trihelix transcription factor GTL2-like n=1 Tax=Juglans microcarpa x Juglans regia TaxID=2249226 RepID=UPI001B7EC126|nr:trihelix transcription factor GTL2-like [Juglans microcarpa x Juglans regia]
MFDGVPDQFHHFIASSRTTLPLPLSFPLHAAAASNPSQNITFPPYDHYEPPPPNSHHHQAALALHPTLLQPLHHQSPTHKDHEEKEENNLVSVNLDIERERSIQVQQPIDPAWTNEEVIALLRIRSSMENWFPEFTWEHVSRKLAELGFKRSAAKCKEKFDEESRYFNSNINYGKSYRFFCELEELYHGNQNPDDHVGTEKNGQKMEKPSHDQGGQEDHNLGQSLEADHSRDGIVGEHFKDIGTETVAGKAKRKKRKRKKFEMLKGLCEKIVSKMMAQQEEMHHKLLEDLVKRDEEKVAKEEAWKKQEMDRMNRELEIMSHEQAIAGDRQATIIEFLKQIASSSFASQYFNEERHDIQADSLKVTKSSNSYPPSTTSSSLIQAPNPNPASHINNQNTVEAPQLSFAMDHQGHQNSSSLSTKGNSITPTSITKTLARHQNPSLNTLAPNTPEVPTSTSPTLPLSSQNPNSPNTQSKPLTPISTSTHKDSPNSIANIVKDDLGKRWPRDEVLALINLRCSLYNNGEDKELGAKGPLWERISQGMLELGYKRSGKRCKEKWENINKYFRKTKDVNKKRSLDSRTCPYFHQLSTLYNQGTLVIASSEGPENHLISSSTTTAPENHLPLPDIGLNSSQGMSSSLNSTILQVAEGEKNMVQAQSFDFELI